MTSEPLTPERVLEATEEVLRRYGPGKANVVDVARALGVSHGSVYRHFASKVALREAVTERWLDEAHAMLPLIVAGNGTAAERLARWLTELCAAKRRKAGSDPELFATYVVLADESSGMVERHVGRMVGQIAALLDEGVARGEFTLPGGTAATARAVWDATARFHDPVHAADWSAPGVDDAFTAVLALVLRGLLSGSGSRPEV